MKACPEQGQRDEAHEEIIMAVEYVILSEATLAPHASAGENPSHDSRDPSRSLS